MSYSVIAMLMFAMMLFMLSLGQRVFAGIGFVATVFALWLWGTSGYSITFSAGITLMNWYALLTLPMFIYMGYMLSESGIAGDLYDLFHVMTGPMPGGLAVGTIFLMVIISALNGLSVAGMAIGTSIALPELMRRNYDKRMVTGVIQGGSTLGIMIPPSVVLILFGVIARVPVGQLWAAGIMPGLLLAFLMVGYVLIRCWLNPELGPPLPKEQRDKLTWQAKLKTLSAGILPAGILFAMTGLFMMGVTSLVEMSAVGATAATVATLIKGRLTRKVLRETLRKTLSVSCMFMWIILAAMAFGAIFDGLRAGEALNTLFNAQLGLGPWEIIILMQITFIIMGMFLDDTAMLIIVAPLYVPIIRDLGFSPVWFGILYTITCQLAYMTPPFGYNLFLMRAMAPSEISLADIYRSIIPFAILMIIGLAIIMIFPQIAMWLPKLIYGDYVMYG